MIRIKATGRGKFTGTGLGVRMGAAMCGATAGLSAPTPIHYTVHRFAGPPGPGCSPG